MARVASIVLVISLAGGCALAAQLPGEDPHRASLPHEATSGSVVEVLHDSPGSSHIDTASIPPEYFDDGRGDGPRTEREGVDAATSQDHASNAFWPKDPNATRLLVGPTARSLKQGESYLDVFGISVPFVQIGLTDRISIGAGTPVLIPGLRPGDVFWVTPKVQVFAGRKTSAAVGVLHGSDGGKDGAGIAYGVVTRGTADAAVTAGVGYAYRRSNTSDGGAPVIMVSGEKRVTRLAKVMTENYVTPGGALVSGGVRLVRERVTFDLGLGVALGTGGAIPLPIIRFAWKLWEPPHQSHD